MRDVTYNPDLDEYVAHTLAGNEVFGATLAQCEQRLREANRAYAKHQRTNVGERADVGAYWEGRAGKCFLCNAPIADGRAICLSCLREVRAQADDYKDEFLSQAYPALA